jgi:hypothetical protein
MRFDWAIGTPRWQLHLHTPAAPLQPLRTQFETLRDDFQYNLRLLGDRDAELADLERSVAAAAATAAERNRQLTELRAAYDEAYAGRHCSFRLQWTFMCLQGH